MYLGGNGFYWIISFDPSRPHYIEVRRWYGTQAWEAGPGEYYHNTTGELGGLWRHRGRAAQALVGVGTAAEGSDSSMPYLRTADSYDERAAFIFEGIGKDEQIGDFGLVMRGAGGFEMDRADAGLGTPPHALVLATASGFSDEYHHVVEEILNTNPWECGTKSPDVRADMIYFEGPKGGAVFSVGSIAWCGSLSHNNYNNNVSRITDNVLRHFTSR
jgi:N,N-dimethylformamidase